MNQHIVSLDTVRQSDTSRVGTKAAVLETLAYAGYPAPPGLCVTTSAFHLALQSHDSEISAITHQQDLDDPRKAEAASKALAELLADLQVPPAVT